ncbi:MAG: hypothetical protein CVV58_04490, partial [Tenericutes bacterium HGW-Tenericutes-3]
MQEFGRYYTNLLNQLFNAVLDFFRGIFQTIGEFFSEAYTEIIKGFFISSSDFSLLDWIMAFGVLVANVVFFGILFYKIF